MDEELKKKEQIRDFSVRIHWEDRMIPHGAIEEWFGAIYQGVDYSWRFEVSTFGRLRNAKTKSMYTLSDMVMAAIYKHVFLSMVCVLMYMCIGA